MSTDIFDRAFEVALAAGGPASRDGLAHPFGLGESEPLRWRVSQDVWDQLIAKAKGYSAPPLGPSAADRLLGYPIRIDDTLPADSLLLEPDAT